MKNYQKRKRATRIADKNKATLVASTRKRKPSELSKKKTAVSTEINPAEISKNNQKKSNQKKIKKTLAGKHLESHFTGNYVISRNGK